MYELCHGSKKRRIFNFKQKTKVLSLKFLTKDSLGFGVVFSTKQFQETLSGLFIFLLQNLIFAIFSFICGSRKFNHDQKSLLFTLVLSCLEGFMSLTKHPLVSVSQTSIGFLKKLLVFQKIENRLCTRSFGTAFMYFLKGG